VTIIFTGKSSVLTPAEKVTLTKLGSELKSSDLVTCAGYAKNDAALAQLRANTVAKYLSSQVNAHFTLRDVTATAASQTIVTIK
jgi:outer membrane protein OmpA-like peptidoglycan-associated protein